MPLGPLIKMRRTKLILQSMAQMVALAQCRSITTRSNADNETWTLTNGETDNSGATITRNYVLIHIGNYPWDMTGCLLIGSRHSVFALDTDYYPLQTGDSFEEGWVV